METEIHYIKDKSFYSNSKKYNVAYKTKNGILYNGLSEDILYSRIFNKYMGKVNLIFTSPPFPLNRKKKYGNKNGEEYKLWIANFVDRFKELLAPDGSIVMEIGNAWNRGSPTMSTLGIETFLEFINKGDLKLCEEFIAYYKTRLPTPTQWVNVERIRVKDALTHIWWMSKTEKPKANNLKVLQPYSESMKYLLEIKKYNSGKRPSEHHIGEKSFLTDNGGSIPSNLLAVSNSKSNDPYLKFCKMNNIPIHPARMPEEIPTFFIKLLTDPGDIVLDPFAGSNVTGFVAESLGRKWISIEANSIYAKSSKSRFKSTIRGKALE